MKAAKVFLLAGILFSSLYTIAQNQDAKASLADLWIRQPENGAITDRGGHAKIIPGKETKFINGPLGMKALKFDGSREAVAKLDLGKEIKDKLDGFDFTISFWVRLDSILPKNQNRTGLGMNFSGNQHFSMGFPITGPGGNATFWSAVPVEKGKWHQISFTYSIDKGEMKLYLDGNLHQSSIDAELFPLKLNFNEIGTFDGALASIQIWDRALSEEELSTVAIGPESFMEYRSELEKFNPDSKGLAQMRDNLLKRLTSMRSKDKVTLSELNDLTKQINTMLHLRDAAKALKSTSLSDAPFALMEVRPVSPIIRTPEAFPPDAEYTSNLRVAAAKGEYEPLSFIIHPYQDIEKFEFIPGDFKSKDGAVIPASAIDKKVVKCWYQANWNSYFNSGNQILVPDLLLNDDTLVKVDEIKRKNFLRIDYPEGAKYCDVNFSGNFENVKPFNYCIEPVKDAKTLQPVKLTPGRGTQFWLTVHVPQDAKSGLYTSRVQTRCDGKDTGTFDITLRVYPFELPRAKTAYNLNEDYITFIIGVNLGVYAGMTKDLDEAARILKMDYANMAAHNIHHPGVAVFDGSKRSEEVFLRDVALQKEAGMSLKPVCSAGAADDGGFIRNEGKEERTPEDYKKNQEEFKKKMELVLPVVQKAFGHNDIHFYGIDEAQHPGTLRAMAPYRDILFRMGAKVFTSGWHDNYLYLPAYENIHAQAAEIAKPIADRWHAIKGKLVCYAGPFAGPDNPDLMRRSHGMKMYRADYDGFFMLSYASGLHLWNERVNGRYRNFTMAYPTVNGPVNSIAFEGLREGLDDIRYATLLRQLAEECFASGNQDAIYTAKKAIAWFELTDADKVDLDLLRMEMADHIIQMMKVLGKEVKG